MRVIISGDGRHEQGFVVTLQDSVCRSLREKGVDCANITHFLPPDLEERIVSWYKAFSKTKVGGKPLHDHFVYKGLSFWWVMEDWLFEAFAFAPRFRDILTNVSAFLNIIEEKRPQQLVYYGKDDAFHACLAACAAAKKIPLVSHCTPDKTQIPAPWLIRSYLGYRHAARRLYALFLRQERIPLHPVIFMSTLHWRRHYDPATEQFLVGDPYLSPVAGFVLQETPAVLLDMPSEHTREIGLGRMRSKAKLRDQAFFERFLRCGDYFAAEKDRQALAEEARIVAKGLENTRFRDVPVWPLLEKQYFAYFRSRLFGHLLFFAGVERMIKECEPAVLVSPEETGPHDKILFHLAKKNNVKVVCIQHGVVQMDSRCRRLPGEKSPLPDAISLFGPSDKEFLVKSCHYDPSLLKVLGSARFDVLAMMPKLYRRDQIRKELGLTRKTVLIASQPYPDLEERFGYVRESCKLLAKMDVDVIIKVHHFDTSFSEYESITRDAGLKHCKVLQKEDTYKLLLASDLVILLTSTMTLEAMILGKPVLAVNLTGKHDLLPYITEGMTINARTKDELASHLRAWRAGKVADASVIRKRVERCCATPDGHAAERISRLVLSFVPAHLQLDQEKGLAGGIR
ncbi:MAG: hypothetical protein V1735_03325 [Nanoarchaeota archaeon]